MGSGRNVVAEVAEVEFEVPEELGVGRIDEGFGHLPHGLLGVGPHPGEEGLDARFAAFRDRRRCRRSRRQHGCRLAVRAEGGFEFPDARLL